MTEIIQTIKLSSTKDGKISLANISNPYGIGSADVLSLGICLKSNSPEWHIHIPYENLDELIVELEKIKNTKKV